MHDIAYLFWYTLFLANSLNTDPRNSSMVRQTVYLFLVVWNTIPQFCISCVSLLYEKRNERTSWLSEALKHNFAVSTRQSSEKFYVNVACFHGLLVLLQRYFFRLLAFWPLHMFFKWSVLLVPRDSCEACSGVVPHSSAKKAFSVRLVFC